MWFIILIFFLYFYLIGFRSRDFLFLNFLYFRDANFFFVNVDIFFLIGIFFLLLVVEVFFLLNILNRFFFFFCGFDLGVFRGFSIVRDIFVKKLLIEDFFFGLGLFGIFLFCEVGYVFVGNLIIGLFWR